MAALIPLVFSRTQCVKPSVLDPSYHGDQSKAQY